MKNLQDNILIEPDEVFVVEANAKIILPGRKIKVKLVLTDKRLFFKGENDLIKEEFELKKVQAIYLLKVLFIPIGFKMIYHNEIIKVIVEYSADWVKLIQKQMISA